MAERDRSALRGQVQALSDAAEMLSAATSRGRLCQVAAEGARKLTGWDGAVTWLQSDAEADDHSGVPETIAARLRHGDIALI